MRQQVNLYQPIFRQERKLFSAATVAVACGLIALTYVGIYMFARYNVGAMEREVDQLRKQASAQETMLDTTATLRAQRAQPAQLDAQVARLATELATRTRALELLRSGSLGEPTGFAARLEALARGHLDGVWLDRVILTGAQGSHGSVQLQGATVEAELVPRYLQGLANESVLRGTRFAQFLIERPKRNAGEPELGIRFSATSAALVDAQKEPS